MNSKQLLASRRGKWERGNETKELRAEVKRLTAENERLRAAWEAAVNYYPHLESLLEPTP